MEVDEERAGEWTFDPAHTRIGFSARHAMVTKVRGAFNEIDGRLHVDPADTSRSSVSVRLKAASVDTRNAQRDAHLRSAEFFDAERYPDVVFTSRTIDEVEERMFVVIGDLTIRGITHEIAFPIELRGVGRGADGELRAGFEGSRRVDRRAWGLEWQVPLDTGGVLVSERVTVELEISAVKVPDLADPPRIDTTASDAVAPDSAPLGPRPSGAERLTPPPAATRPRPRGRHRAPTTGWLDRLRSRGGRQ